MSELLPHSKGADYVIDYTKEDFTKNGKNYDLIVQVNGFHSIFSYKRALSSEGRYLLVGSSKILRGFLQVMIFAPLLSRKNGKRLGFMGIAKLNQKDLSYLGQLLEDRKIRPLIDRSYKLNESVEAFEYFEEGHVQGKVVIRMEQS